ncbi:basic helix-loop-helix transcription factor scleraxis-like [Tachyglossus aculeatus]|uniref:basic helix-loop-helix transcription factor scleraxis-like n=1 Tax=Tachyglossus aculeatus TaxID=9261 RepID=UPI0018F78A58|nr:basic helix-loop-helix transcription factor scleraxis-like [Tachyglossus aculeatus]
MRSEGPEDPGGPGGPGGAPEAQAGAAGTEGAGGPCCRRRRRGGRPGGQRQAANARERDRTHSVNTAFSTLRTLIPTDPADRRLSKAETLRLASSYIAHLAGVLRQPDPGPPSPGGPCPGPPVPGGPCPGPGPPSTCPETTPSEPGLHCQPQRPGGVPRPICTFCLSDRRKRVRPPLPARPSSPSVPHAIPFHPIPSYPTGPVQQDSLPCLGSPRSR